MSDNEKQPVKQTRPYWLQLPDPGVWIGFTKGQWPIQAFGEESQAAFWASEKPDERAVIGPIEVPDDIPAFRGKLVPAERILEHIS